MFENSGKGFMSLLTGIIRGHKNQNAESKVRQPTIHDFEIVKPISRGAYGYMMLRTARFI